MQQLQQFFTCCGKENNQDELTITMKKRSIKNSLETQTPKIYIKRSIGKNPILDLSFKKHTVSTLITLGGCSSTRAKHQKDKDRSILTFHQLSMSFDNIQKNGPNQQEQSRQSSFAQKNKEINERSVNVELNRFQEKDKEEFIYKPKEIDPFTNIKENVRSNYFLNRKNRFGKDFIKKQRKVENKDTEMFAQYKKCGLDTIQQRSSIPSLDEFNEIRQISSKATLKLSQDHQKNPIYSRNISKQFCKSSILAAHKSHNTFQMMNSQNLPNNQNQNPKELQNIITSKLYMDIKFLERQLQNLQQQQKVLKQQKIFKNSQRTKQIQLLSKLKHQFSSNINKNEKQILQIKSLLCQKSKMNH